MPGDRAVFLRAVKLLYAFPEPLPLRRARGIQAVNSVAALAESGVEIDFAYVPAGSENPFTYYAVPRPSQVNLMPLSRSLPWPFDRIHSNRLFAARLRRQFNLTNTLIYVRHLKLAAWLARHSPTPRFVYEAHEVFGDTAPPGKRVERRNDESLIMRTAVAILANSGATARRLVELYGNPRMLEVIPNGVTPPESLPQKDWSRPGEHIVYSGSLFPWKGAADLVAAAKDLPNCKIEIIGGEADQIVKMKATLSKSGAAVRFAGHLPHAMAMEQVTKACIAVLPNRADTDSGFTSPIKLFEYMAAGCAIVASDLAPMREILDEDDVLWTIPGNPKSIAAAINALVDDPARAHRLGEKVRLKASQYTWQARAARVKALLSKIGEHP